MRFDILTIFPNYFVSPLSVSLLDKAIEQKRIEVNLINIRDFASDPHHRTDDEVYGGGPGMVMKPEPIAAALDHLVSHAKEKPRIVYLTAQGKSLTQAKVKELSGWPYLILICGRYEGVDGRIIDEYVDEELSIGDYVLMGGEVAAMVVIECIARYCPGVVGNTESLKDESFEGDRLESPHYTRPRVFRGREVPSVLVSGNHREIAEFREKGALTKTRQNRPDLLKPTKILDKSR